MKIKSKIMIISLFCLFYTNVYSNNNDYAILVEKENHRLNLFRIEENNFYLIKQYSAVTGKKRGNKIEAGDKKTPEGIYFTTQTRTNNELLKIYGKIATKYGPKAFVLNYPNIFDTQEKKTGSGIWIHGVDSDARVSKAFDTEGCVALSNMDVTEISDYIDHFNTPIVIVDDANTENIKEIFGQTDKYLAWLEEWRKSWETLDFVKYESYYSDRFESNHKDKEKWVEFKKHISEQNQNITISIENPKVIEFKNQLVIMFKQRYSSSLTNDTGRKFLYLQKEANEYKILAEDFYPITNWN